MRPIMAPLWLLPNAVTHKMLGREFILSAVALAHRNVTHISISPSMDSEKTIENCPADLQAKEFREHFEAGEGPILPPLGH